MKTENNLENKAKFFAQYWGQEIVKWNFSAGGHSSMKLTVDDIRLNAPNESDFFLELTLLSQITDEDALFIGGLIDLGYFDKKDIIELTKGCINSAIKGSSANIICWVNIFDYLRSKGYALPWMDLSVEDLVEYGWIKLKD